MGTRGEKGDWRNDPSPGIWSLGLQLPVPPLLLQGSSQTDKFRSKVPDRSRCWRIARGGFSISPNAGRLTEAAWPFPDSPPDGQSESS